MENKKILVAFFSRMGENYFPGSIRSIEKGNTHMAAQMIAQALGADLFEIEAAEPYSDVYKECVMRAKQEMDLDARPALVRDTDISAYDVIFLGYPNWCGTMPRPVWTFLESHDFTGKLLCPFCTHEGSGLANSPADIKKLAPGADLQEGLAIKGSQVRDGDATVEHWSKGLMAF